MSKKAQHSLIVAPEGALPAWCLVSPILGCPKSPEGCPLEFELLPFETEAGMRAEALVVADLLRTEGTEWLLSFSFAPVAPERWSKAVPFAGPGKVVKLRAVRP